MTTMSPNELRKKGIEALTEALGPVGMVRFLQQFDTGKGNYTEERKKWLGKTDIDEIVENVKRQRKE